MSLDREQRQKLITMCAAMRDDEITPAEVSELEQLVTTNPDAMQLYVRFMALTASLDFDGVIEAPSIDTTVSVKPRHRSWRRLAAVAALLLVVVSVSIVYWPMPPSSKPAIARLHRTVDAQFVGQHAAIHDGDFMMSGTFDLASGFAELHLTNDVELIFEGPAQFELVSDMRVVLRHGKVVADVPPAARGFVVSSREVQVIDLGTRFGIYANEKSGTQVQVMDGKVMDGKVIVRLPDETDSPEPLEDDRELKTDDWEIYEPDTLVDGKQPDPLEPVKFVTELPASTDEKPTRVVVPPASEKRGQSGPTVSAKVRQKSPPPNLKHGALQNNNFVHLFCERNWQIISEPLNVDTVETGRHAPPKGDSTSDPTEVSVNEPVNSYLLHFEPRKQRKKRNRTISGTVRFQQPILGIIWSAKLLNATDQSLGAERTTYEKGGYRGLESPDSFRISEDRRVLAFKMHASMVDQIRVIVAAGQR